MFVRGPCRADPARREVALAGHGPLASPRCDGSPLSLAGSPRPSCPPPRAPPSSRDRTAGDQSAGDVELRRRHRRRNARPTARAEPAIRTAVDSPPGVTDSGGPARRGDRATVHADPAAYRRSVTRRTAAPAPAGSLTSVDDATVALHVGHVHGPRAGQLRTARALPPHSPTRTPARSSKTGCIDELRTNCPESIANATRRTPTTPASEDACDATSRSAMATAPAIGVDRLARGWPTPTKRRGPTHGADAGTPRDHVDLRHGDGVPDNDGRRDDVANPGCWTTFA